MRNLLLLSNSTQHGSGFLEYCSELVKSFFSKHGVTKILFIPYAIRDHDGYAEKAKKAFYKIGITVESVHEKDDPLKAVMESKGIFIGGGNTFQLLKALYDNNLIEGIRKQVLENGIPYMGASAGTNVATVSICTTNDMPIVYPPSFNALGLVPFNINPHYIEPVKNSTHMGETRDERLKEYHCIPGMPKVLGLKEGCILHVDGDNAQLQGISGARIFSCGKDPVDIEVGSDVTFLLNDF